MVVLRHQDAAAPDAEGIEILGDTALTVSTPVASGACHEAVRYQHNGLDRDDVERLSLDRFKIRRGHPYWVTELEAARILGVARSRVYQLRQQDRLPVVEYRGRHYYRRAQLEVLANARESRRVPGQLGASTATS